MKDELVQRFLGKLRPLALARRPLESFVAVLAAVIVAASLSCQRKPPEPVTITFMDPEWSHDLSRRSALSEENLREFERQSGIRVKHLPAPETSLQQLALVR